MGKIVQTSDFIGKYAITQNSFNTAYLQDFIDRFETTYLYDLLGVELGGLMYSSIVTPYTPPTPTELATIFFPLNSDEPYIRSKGIKEMLLGFIFFEYTRTQNVVNTGTGNVTAQNEVSVVANWGHTDIYNNYNSSINTYKAIQEYISYNATTYPLFKGVCKSHTSQFV